MFLITIMGYFSLMLLAFKLFGKTGLFIWTSISMVLGTIEATKFVDMFGLTVTLGNVIYGSSFLATDILSEIYGKEEAKKSVYIGLFTSFTFIIFSLFIVMFESSSQDIFFEDVDLAIHLLFGLAPRISVASIVTYAISQQFDIWIYHMIWKKTNNKYLWIRNNGSTLISQLLDTTLFTFLAFGGVTENLISLIIGTYILKVIVSILDTPFMYMSKKIKPNFFEI